MLGNNMFAYCRNNPVMQYDPTGNICMISFLDKDNSLSAAWLELAVGLGGRAGSFSFKREMSALIQQLTEDAVGTVAYGISLSAAGGFQGSIAFAITFDERGNVGFIFTKSAGAGSPSAGISIFKSKTNAPSITDQAGAGLNIGGSGSFYGVSVGGEYNVLLAGDNMYTGYTVSAGVGVGLPVEGHGSFSETTVFGVFNLYEILLGVPLSK